MSPLLARIVERVVWLVGLGWLAVKVVIVLFVGAVLLAFVWWLLQEWVATHVATPWRRWRDHRRDLRAIEQLRRGRAHYVRSPHVMARRPRWHT